MRRAVGGVEKRILKQRISDAVRVPPWLQSHRGIFHVPFNPERTQMVWISLLVFGLAVALIQLGAAIIKVSVLTITLKCLVALLMFFLLAVAAYAAWNRIKGTRFPM